MERFTLTDEIFRQINTISRNLLKKALTRTSNYFNNFVWKLHETTSTLKSNSPLSIEVCSDKNCSPFSNFQLNSSKLAIQLCSHGVIFLDAYLLLLMKERKGMFFFCEMLNCYEIDFLFNDDFHIFQFSFQDFSIDQLHRLIDQSILQSN